VFTLIAAVSAVSADGYKLVKTIPVPGDGGWDYLTVDGTAQRVYVSHGNQVDVIDADANTVAGTISDLKGVHGIAVAADLGRGFISNGRGNNVTIFDLKTLKKIGDPVATGKNPDAILYDPATKGVFAFNGRDGTASVIDAAEGKVLGTIELGGKPEFAVSDGAGAIFDNLEDKSTIIKIDAKNRTVTERWPIAPGEEPSALALDAKNHRLFAGCGNKMMVVIDAESGKVIDHEPIGAGVDAGAFDPETGLIYFSCGDGTTTVIHEDGPDKYTFVETVKTKARSKTMTLDPKTHDIFLPSADFTPSTNGGRPSVTSGSFAVLRFSKG
jgi:DNA-binding beta-propeller fold protein YncE